jgi:hypothetical protein
MIDKRRCKGSRRADLSPASLCVFARVSQTLASP